MCSGAASNFMGIADGSRRHCREVVVKWTGIPVAKMLEGERDNLRQEEVLRKILEKSKVFHVITNKQYRKARHDKYILQDRSFLRDHVAMVEKCKVLRIISRIERVKPI